MTLNEALIIYARYKSATLTIGNKNTRIFVKAQKIVDNAAAKIIEKEK